MPRPVRSPRPFWTSFPFYSLFPSSFAQLDSDAAEQLDVDVTGSAFPTTLINGGGKESVALTEPPSIQPRPNLQPGAWSLPASSTPTCRACRLFLEASLPLSRAAESYSWEAALLRKGVKCWQKKKKNALGLSLSVGGSLRFLSGADSSSVCRSDTPVERTCDAFDELIKTQLI